MKRADDFPQKVTTQLAKRAGYRCSICRKSTIGPGNAPGDSISDGIAAHIIAASPDRGPRHDSSLSPEQRRSYENGIWVCTRHGREVDSDVSAYSVAALRGLKYTREEEARKELQKGGRQQDATGGLIELACADNRYTLFELVTPQPYNYPTTAALREQLRLSSQSSRLLTMASEIIVEAWESPPDVAGILSTLLSSNLDLWQPSTAVLDKLQSLCEAQVKDDDWSRVALTEPLSFALAAKRRTDVHSKVLQRLVDNPQWRAADSGRVREYYGTLGVQIAATVRHWQDRFRKGILRANDVPRLMEILLSSDLKLRWPRAFDQLLDLLAEQAKILDRCQETKLARRVQDVVEALRLSRE